MLLKTCNYENKDEYILPNLFVLQDKYHNKIIYNGRKFNRYKSTKNLLQIIYSLFISKLYHYYYYLLIYKLGMGVLGFGFGDWGLRQEIKFNINYYIFN